MKKLFFTLLIFAVAIAKAEIVTPYPTTIEIKQINSAEKERLRLCQGHKKYDKQPTGFYVAADKKVVVNVEILTAADNDVMPTLTIGTMGFNVDNRMGGGSYNETVIQLKAGKNTIEDHVGGLIWLGFVQNESGDPKGLAKITFTDESEQVRVPRFIYGTTTNTEFKEMLVEYPTPDVLYQSDYIVVAATKEAANRYSKDNNKVEWMNGIHRLLEKEDEISGIDNNDPNPIHHRLKAGEVRHLLVQNTSGNPHASSEGYTGYPQASINRYLTVFNSATNNNNNNSWMLGHELGHQHQQPAYQINKATESTVNIYSYVVERDIQGETYNRTTAEKWRMAQTTYLRLPFSKRIYDMDDDELKAIWGANQDELRFMPWEQLFLIFGDQFYKTLHRVVREEMVITPRDPQDLRRSYLIWKTSQVAGYDLTEFFNIWGIRVTDPIIKSDLRTKMAFAKANDEIHDLEDIELSAEKLVTITGQNLPDWAPISLRGISSSQPESSNELDRSAWTITTSYAGPSDATVGGDIPEYIIDESTTTAFAFVKPGKSYGGITIAADEVPYFTIDMKTEQTFNYVSYMHRSTGNTMERLRARELSIYGSNNGTDFTPLKENYKVDIVKNANEIYIQFPSATYRYIRTVIEDWDPVDGSTVQVANFKVSNLETIENPEPLKFRVNVTADEGIITSQAGVNMEDEDSDYTIEFTLAEGKEIEAVKIDGEAIATPEVNNGSYQVLVKVTNHINVNITSKVAASTESVLSDSPVSFYPNPVQAGEAFYIRLSDSFANSQLTIYNLSGIKISECQVVGNLIEMTINEKGSYIIKTEKNGVIQTQKMLVR